MTTFRKFYLICLLLLSLLISANAEQFNVDFTTVASPANIQASENGEIILASHPYNSVWYTINGGFSWECLDSKIKSVYDLTYSDVRAQLADHSGRKILALCQVNSSDIIHLLYSDNGGQTFVDKSPPSWEEPPVMVKLTVDSFDEDTWLIQTGNLCYYTFNAGNNWNCLPSVPSNLTMVMGKDLFSDPFEQHRYFSLVQYSNTDSGRLEYGGMLYRSENGPYNWELDSPFIHLNEQLGLFRSMVLHFHPLSNGNYLLNICAYSDTSDWSVDHLVTFNSEGEFISRSGGDIQFSRFFHEDSEIPGRIYAFGAWNFVVSNDYGQTWEIMEDSYIPDREGRSIVDISENADASILYCSVGFNGISSSTDHGETWTTVNTFQLPRFRHVYPQSEDLYYYGYGEEWFRFPSGSDELIPITLPDHPDTTYAYEKIAYVNGDTLIGTARVYPYTEAPPHRRLYRTYDGGQSWDMVKDLLDWFSEELDYQSEELTCSGQYFVNCLPDLIEFSEDFGETWTTLPPILVDNQVVIVRQIRLERNNLYTLVELDNFEHLVFKYSFEENRWLEIQLPDLNIDITTIDIAENGLVAADWNGGILKYDGTSWTECCELPPANHYCIVIIEYIHDEEPFVLCHARYQSEIFAARADIQSWYELEFEYPFGLNIYDLRSFKHDPVRDRIWIETSGGVFWFPSEYVLTAPEEPIRVIPANPELFTNYPNPFNASTKIQYHLTEPGNVKLDVYDITGRLVKTLENSYKPAGMQSIYLNGKNLASGTYLIRLDTGEEVRNRRITLVK